MIRTDPLPVSRNPDLADTGRIMLYVGDLYPHPERYDCERDGLCFPLVGGA